MLLEALIIGGSILGRKLSGGGSHNKPKCDLASCGASAERQTNCCNTILCEYHLRKWCACLPGNCPIPGCGKYVRA